MYQWAIAKPCHARFTTTTYGFMPEPRSPGGATQIPIAKMRNDNARNLGVWASRIKYAVHALCLNLGSIFHTQVQVNMY